MFLHKNSKYISVLQIIRRVFCFLAFSACLSCTRQNTGASVLLVDKKHFELFRKKLALPLFSCRTAAARKSEGLGLVNPIDSNRIQ